MKIWLYREFPCDPHRPVQEGLSCHVPGGHVGEHQGQLEAEMRRTVNSVCSHCQGRNRQDRIGGLGLTS